MGRRREDEEAELGAEPEDQFLDDDELNDGPPAAKPAKKPTQKPAGKPTQRPANAPNPLVSVSPDHHARLHRLVLLRQMAGEPSRLGQVLAELLETALSAAEAEFREELAVLEKVRERLARRGE